MKNSLSQASALLDLTRDAYDPPDAAARERVRQRIALALAGAALSSGASAAHATSQSKVHALTQAKGASSITLFAKLALVSSMAMLGGAVWLVFPHGGATGRTQVTWMRMTEAPEVRAPEAPVMRVEPLPERAKDEKLTSTADSQITKQASSPPVRESAPTQARSTPPSASEASSTQAEKPARPAPQAHRRTSRTRHESSLSEEESLEAEVSLLHHAEQALASGEAELALSMLQTHREKFPRALLREEQAGLVALARCTVDADDVRPARSFVARHPDALLNARIRQACALATP